MITRYSASFGISAGVTFSLLLLMQLLIATGKAPIDKTIPVTHHPVLFDITDDTDAVKEESITEPEPVEAPPARPELNDNDVGTLATGRFSPAKPVIASPTDFTTLSNGNAVILVAVQPIYPPRLLSRGIEGYVIVQFNVTEEGTTSDITVLESSHQGFEKNAIKAASQLKYKPRVVDGVPQQVYGIMKQFTFEIEA